MSLGSIDHYLRLVGDPLHDDTRFAQWDGQLTIHLTHNDDPDRPTVGGLYLPCRRCRRTGRPMAHGGHGRRRSRDFDSANAKAAPRPGRTPHSFGAPSATDALAHRRPAGEGGADRAVRALMSSDHSRRSLRGPSPPTHPRCPFTSAATVGRCVPTGRVGGTSRSDPAGKGRDGHGAGLRGWECRALGRAGAGDGRGRRRVAVLCMRAHRASEGNVEHERPRDSHLERQLRFLRALVEENASIGGDVLEIHQSHVGDPRRHPR